MTLTQKLKDFLKEPTSQQCLKNNNFTDIYKNSPNGVPAGDLTAFFLECDIDPFIYMDTIPQWACQFCTLPAVYQIPDNIKHIEAQAFFSCTGNTFIKIPETMTEIPRGAFECFVGLTGVDIPHTTAYIGVEAFSYCPNLSEIHIPSSIKSCGFKAFNSCTSLKSVLIDDLTKWCTIDFEGYEANPLFYAHNLVLNGTPITDLIIPSGIRALLRHSFCGLRGVTSITIPETVNFLDIGCFSVCSDVKTITLLEGVQSIESAAIYNCASLESVTIPRTVQSIGSKTFEGCPRLKHIYYGGTIGMWGLTTVHTGLKNITSGCVVHCFDGDINISD